VTSTAKKAGALWNEMSDDEKAPFSSKALELREVYQELMKDYKPTAGVKAMRVAYDPEEIPEAPTDWSGPFEMRYLKGKVKGVDGKTVRIQKVFDEAVKLASEINAAWTVACEEGDIPSHWSEDSKACSGITKTSTGYDLRFGADLLTQRAEWGSGGGIASWVFGKYDAPKAMVTEKSAVFAILTVDTEDGFGSSEKKDKLEKKAKKAKKDKSAEPEADKSAEPEADKKEKSPEPKKKVKKMVTKAKKSKYPESDMEVIEIEKDGVDVEFMLNEDSGDVFEKSNLMDPVGKVDDGEIMFF
jgi:hypothetical protein